MARKVLIADDSPTVQKKASGVLTGEGLEVVTVSNGVAAIKKLPTVLPMVILADVAMPGKDGYEVCEFVKGSKEYADVPVILIFSDDDVLDEPKRARVRADARIRKPFDRDELISMVNKYLAIAEAASAKPVPPPVIKAPAAPAFVSEPIDEEPVIPEKEPVPDFSQFGGGMAFSDALEEIQAEPLPAEPALLEPAPVEPPRSAEYEIQAEPSSSVEAMPQVAVEPVIEVEQSPAPAASYEIVSEETPPPAAEPLASAEPAAPAEPVLIEEQAVERHEEHDHPHEPATERTIMFRAPADIAQPVLSDELSSAAPEVLPAPEVMPGHASSEAAPDDETGEFVAVKETSSVAPTTLESYSLSEAAAGNVRMAPSAPASEAAAVEELPVAEAPAAEPAPPMAEAAAPGPPVAEAAAVASTDTPHALDPAQIYSIVYLVVAKMSPRLSPQAIEEIARPLANEITAELSAPSALHN